MSQPANFQRGETSLVVKGQLFILRPSFASLVAAEEELGSLFALVDRAAEGEITLSEIIALLWHSMPAETRSQRDEVGEAILAMGLLEATKPVRAILAQVLKGQA